MTEKQSAVSEKPLGYRDRLDGYITPAHFNCWCFVEEDEGVEGTDG